MAELRPFRAVRYRAEGAGEMAAVVAPPYDVISEAYRDVLYERSEYNVIRLILGREADRYDSAAQHWRDWQRRGVLVRELEPRVFLYEQDFPLVGEEVRRRRFGIMGVVRLEPFSSGRIRPHERTLAGPKADRLRLMEACRANLSPIFGLYAGGGHPLEEAHSLAARERPLTDFSDEFDVRHRLWAVPYGLGDRLSALLGPQTVLIADGHHRYETALEYRARLAQHAPLDADDSANFVLMFLCHMGDPGLVILPTHRVLSGLAGFDAARVAENLARVFRLREFPATDDGFLACTAALRSQGEPGHLGVALRGASSVYLASVADRAAMDRAAPDLALAVRNLDVTLLDRLVLRPLFDVDVAAAAHDGRLRYVKDDAEAFGLVRRAEADVALLLNAARVEEVQAVCAGGQTMPEKSTYFYPKLITGLLFHPLREMANGV